MPMLRLSIWMHIYFNAVVPWQVGIDPSRVHVPLRQGMAQRRVSFPVILNLVLHSYVTEEPKLTSGEETLPFDGKVIFRHGVLFHNNNRQSTSDVGKVILVY